MKKLSLYTILVFAISLLFVTFAAAETEGSCGENATWHYDSEKAVLTISGTGETDNYTTSLIKQIGIYDKISLVVEEGITSIGDCMFRYGNIRTVSLPSTLSKIGKRAFSTLLFEEINFPESLVYIDDYAFEYCFKVKSPLDISGLQYIGKNAFYFSDIPGKVTISESTVLCEGAFSDCSRLTELIVEDGVSEIPDSAFSNCNSLEKVSIPENIESIGRSAFYACSNVKTPLDFLNLKTVGKSAFSQSSVPRKVKISSASVSEYAFNYCLSLTDVVFDDSVETIMKGAFKSCKNLKKIDNFEKIKEFSEYAFCGCEGLVFDKIVIRNDVKYNEYAFSGIKVNEVEFEEGYPGVHDGMFAECKQLKKVTLSSTITAIGNCAFKNCQSLEDINIPEAVERIYNEAFKNCSFKSVTIRNGISYYSSVYSDCKNLKEVVLEEGQGQTGDSWFSGCTALEKVELPSNVTIIGSNSFSACVSLKEIDLSNIKTIGSGAFARCRSLTEVNLPKIGEIKANAFVGCIKLRKVNVAGINRWARVTFENALSNPIYYARCIYENGEPVIFPRFVTSEINRFAFVNCSSFLSASFEGNSAYVDNYAFSCCDRLRTVIMLKNTAYFSRNTFAGCNSLRNIIDFSGEFDTDYEVLDLTKKVTVYASKYYPSYDEMRMGYELMYKHNCETSGHKYVNGYFDLISAPTCTEKGQADYKCIYCGKVKWNSIGKLNHIINEAVVEPATVEVDGKIIEKCSLCEAEKETAIPKIAEIKFKNGDTFYRDTMFNDINNSFVITDSVGKEIPHKYFSVSFPEANVSYGIVKITFSGYYSGTAEKRFLILPGKVKLTVRELGQNSILLGWKSPPYSSQCPVEIFVSEDNETFISLGKTTEDNFLIESLSAGKEYYFKAVVSNENGNGEPSYLTIKTINHFHSPVLKKTEEKTCLKSGMKYYECSSCGETWSEVIKATGHNWKCTNVIVEPTCISTGFKEYKCKDCDKKLSIVVPFSDHKVVKDPLVLATLTSDGKTEGSHCSVCNEIIEEQHPIVRVRNIYIIDTYEYDGLVKEPIVFVDDAEESVIDEWNYSVEYSSKSPKEIGTYTATVTMLGYYSGTKVLTFKIVPQQVADLKCNKATTNSVTLSWSKVTGAKYYKVEKSADGKKWTKAVTVKTNTATVNSLKPGTDYFFRVTAIDKTKKLEGKASTPIKAGTVTDAPSITLTSTKSKTATVSWNKVKGASKYIVYKSTDGKKWTKITVSGTSYTMKKLTGGKKIYVKVQVVNAYNQKSALSEVKKVTVKK